jgi:hypothetical protein
MRVVIKSIRSEAYPAEAMASAACRRPPCTSPDSTPSEATADRTWAARLRYHGGAPRQSQVRPVGLSVTAVAITERLFTVLVNDRTVTGVMSERRLLAVPRWCRGVWIDDADICSWGELSWR